MGRRFSCGKDGTYREPPHQHALPALQRVVLDKLEPFSRENSALRSQKTPERRRPCRDDQVGTYR